MFEIIGFIIIMWLLSAAYDSISFWFSSNFRNLSATNSVETVTQNYDKDSNLFAVTLSELEPETNTYLNGNTCYLSIDENHMLYTMDGKHSIRDTHYILNYEVKTHHLKNGASKRYFCNISINDIFIESNLTNLKSSAEILTGIFTVTNGLLFSESLIGNLFIAQIAAMLHFNKFNQGKSLDDVVNTGQFYLIQYMKDAELFVSHIISKIIHKVDENLERDHESNNNSNQYSSSNTKIDFQIYLKILELPGHDYTSFEDIKNQYRKLVRKYHPDSQTGDTQRFKLIQEAYEFLDANYPR